MVQLLSLFFYILFMLSSFSWSSIEADYNEAVEASQRVDLDGDGDTDVDRDGDQAPKNNHQKFNGDASHIFYEVFLNLVLIRKPQVFTSRHRLNYQFLYAKDIFDPPKVS